MTIFELHDEPALDDPVLVMALDGWVDAGGAAARAVDEILDQSSPSLVGRFDDDALLDFRARRPTMFVVEGQVTDLTWNTTDLVRLHAPNGRDVLLLHGPEPDHRWHEFCDTVVDLSHRFGCGMLIGLGAYPAGVPHSRPVRTSANASSTELAVSLGSSRTTVESPAGIHAAIQYHFSRDGRPSVGIWAQVPHYLNGMPYPAAAGRLIEACNQVARTDFSLGEIPSDAESVRTRIDSLIDGNPQHVAMVRQLEELFDAESEQRMGELPSGDDLAEELQRFLREQDD